MHWLFFFLYIFIYWFICFILSPWSGERAMKSTDLGSSSFCSKRSMQHCLMKHHEVVLQTRKATIYKNPNWKFNIYGFFFRFLFIFLFIFWHTLYLRLTVVKKKKKKNWKIQRKRFVLFFLQARQTFGCCSTLDCLESRSSSPLWHFYAHLLFTETTPAINIQVCYFWHKSFIYNPERQMTIPTLNWELSHCSWCWNNCC